MKQKLEAVVIAQCVACGARREIKPGEVPKGGMPTCDKCYCVMVAVEAKSRRRGESGFTLAEVLVGLAIGLIFGLVLWSACVEKKGSNSLAPIVANAAWEDKLKGKMVVICLDGFEYYFSSITSYGESSDESRAVMAPKFDVDRLPKKCAVEEAKP